MKVLLCSYQIQKTKYEGLAKIRNCETLRGEYNEFNGWIYAKCTAVKHFGNVAEWHQNL